MYNNDESFNEYIRQILGYPNITKEISNNYTTNNANIYRNTNSFNNNSNRNINNCIENRSNQNCTIKNANCEQNKILEKLYPEIYKVIYPMVNKKCSDLTKSVTSETVNEITKEIFLAIEPSAAELSEGSTAKELTVNTKISNTTKTSSGSGNLTDLIKILVIREIISNQKSTTAISQNMYNMPYNIQKDTTSYNNIYEY